jgi:4a-hydroxytetrahydrobiopterin dehydratase
MSLKDQKCITITAGTPPVSASEAKELHTEIPLWILAEKSISREFKFPDFNRAMQFVNGVAELANKENHHPDIYISYSKVRLELSTHKIGGLSINDFILAAKIDWLMGA